MRSHTTTVTLPTTHTQPLLTQERTQAHNHIITHRVLIPLQVSIFNILVITSTPPPTTTISNKTRYEMRQDWKFSKVCFDNFWLWIKLVELKSCCSKYPSLSRCRGRLEMTKLQQVKTKTADDWKEGDYLAASQVINPYFVPRLQSPPPCPANWLIIINLLA